MLFRPRLAAAVLPSSLFDDAIHEGRAACWRFFTTCSIFRASFARAFYRIRSLGYERYEHSLGQISLHAINRVDYRCIHRLPNHLLVWSVQCYFYYLYCLICELFVVCGMGREGEYGLDIPFDSMSDLLRGGGGHRHRELSHRVSRASS